jgi:hypothetical protein
VRCAVVVVVCVAMTACVPEAVTTARPNAGDGAPKKRRLVHVDHVDPMRVGEFEESRRALLAAYAARSIREGTTVLLETKDDEGRPEFLSMRPFGAYAEIDRLNDEAAARAAALGRDLDTLDAKTHATLVPPHANEIWLLHRELSYAPPGGPTEATAAAARLEEEVVVPARGEDYEVAVKAVVAALGSAKSAVTRLAFTSSYGTGSYVTLWLASSAPELDGLTTGDVANAIQHEREKTVGFKSRVAFVRKELSSP